MGPALYSGTRARGYESDRVTISGAAGKRHLDQRSGAPLQRFERLLPRDSGDIFHDNDRVNAKHESERIRKLAIGGGIDLVSCRRQRLCYPFDAVPGPPNASRGVKREAKKRTQGPLVRISPHPDPTN